MAGMLQIITYLLAFYLVMKGVEIFQIGLASSREGRGALTIIGVVSIIACVLAAVLFVTMQDNQAMSMQRSTSSIPDPSSFGR